jgi:hypothetical protein
MQPEHEIDFEALIDRSIKDFQPAKRLWPVATRLGCWILLGAAILGLTVWIRGWESVSGLAQHSRQLFATGLFLSASIVTAYLGLSSAIPGRRVTWPQLVLAITLIGAGFIISFDSASGIRSGEFGGAGVTTTLQMIGLAALPWLSLFWAVRRGVPLQPEKTGLAIGLAAFCFALVARVLMFPPDEASNLVLYLLFSGGLLTLFSALAANAWLDWISRWQQEREASEAPWHALFKAQVIFPIALSASIAALIFVLMTPSQQLVHISDFDRAIASYEGALVGFRPNVPSTSMETMLTAFVERGMPAYMWDFGPEGFKLMGGRWEPLPDGTPATYTWFRGQQGGVICMFRQTAAFNPPSLAHDELHHLLFYRYRGFSFCLINVGGYGSFISVIAAPMPLKEFEHLVLRATL